MISPIHPFPARMAPEIVLDETASLRRGSLLLDPMTGSGTVVREASENKHKAIGFDLDPLAVFWRIAPLGGKYCSKKVTRLASTRFMSIFAGMKATDCDLMAKKRPQPRSKPGTKSRELNYLYGSA